MFKTLLKSKSRRAGVTQCELHYEGSCAVDEDLLDAANIVESEQIYMWKINNDVRFITYAILSERGSRIISGNDSAALRAAVGDMLIITTFCQVHEVQLENFKTQIVLPTNKTISGKCDHNGRSKRPMA